MGLGGRGPGEAGIGIDLGIEGFSTATLIGQGGFGAVYRARQDALERWVAIKILTMAAMDDETLARFDRECRAFGALSDHPYIVGVHGCGMNQWGRPYIVMDHVEDGSLAARIKRRGPMRWTSAVELFVKIASAVQAAHDAGILHRDIKPQNILLSRYGDPLLSDFGISSIAGQHTSSDGLTASLEHAAPELLDGAPPSETSDVYSLASTLFVALAGTPPFGYDAAGSLPGLISLITSSDPPDLRPRGVPGAIAVVIERGLAKDPGQRYASAVAFAQALQDVQEAQGIPTTAVPVSSEESEDALVEVERFVPPAPITAPTREQRRSPGHAAPEPRRRRRKRPNLSLLLAVPLIGGAIAAALLLHPPKSNDSVQTVALLENSPTSTPSQTSTGIGGGGSVAEGRAHRPRERREKSHAGGRTTRTHRQPRVVHVGPVAPPPSGGGYAPPPPSNSGTSSAPPRQAHPAQPNDRRRARQQKPEPPPPPPRPSTPMYHLYKKGDHIMTVDPNVIDSKTNAGYHSVLEGYVYRSPVEDTWAIQLTYETVYVMSDPQFETEPAATHDELYRLTWQGEVFYTNHPGERYDYVGRGWASTRHPVGWVQSN